MRHDVDDIIVTDEEIEAMRIGAGPELAQALAVCERGIKKARERAKAVPETPECCADGWKLYERNGELFAEPCKEHFPDYVPPEDRSPDPGSKGSKERMRQRNLDRVKREFNIE